MNNPGSFSCGCVDGYGLIGAICSDLDECVLNTHDCDHICTNNDGSFDCTCRTGYGLATAGASNARVGKDCFNLDECTDGTHYCHPSAWCIDTDGSFECECADGYDGAGTAASPCLTTMLRNTKCTDFACQILICESGFDGDPYKGQI